MRGWGARVAHARGALGRDTGLREILGRGGCGVGVVRARACLYRDFLRGVSSVPFLGAVLRSPRERLLGPCALVPFYMTVPSRIECATNPVQSIAAFHRRWLLFLWGSRGGKVPQGLMFFPGQSTFLRFG